ncbi:MAG: 3-hydroxyacyl-CoA dehydrogenase / enoyl-CoA hydratase / 3-hydroxybutyryl-CoA epimerase [Parcubacteria group bacterium Gr01-1014_19]|nr:MAG: 3-hydroxyacyl-CoA dehydrogenase / enoyl-CoA hydratase / 3-hydroxybutyryl-CoA epimerase [Parcubacteria group bacterium Gr01-1014_19]
MCYFKFGTFTEKEEVGMEFWKLDADPEDARGMILTLDLGPQEKKNLLRRKVLEELDATMDQLVKLSPDYLIIRSGKPNTFCAGADVEEILEVLKNPADVDALLRKAHGILMKIRNATYPVVAAIDGECLGGGLELAMACHARVATNNRKTAFALPETSLGIIPGFGGTQTLPRLVGARKALEIINGQKKLNGAEAAKCGLADACVKPEELMSEARWKAYVTQKGWNERFDHKPKNLRLPESIPCVGKRLILRGALQEVLKKTKGAYPAPLKAIEAVRASSKSIEKGLALERKLFAECANSPEAKSLTSVFFLDKEARSKDWLPGVKAEVPKKIGMIGAGIMGSGIAYAAISSNIPVVLHDTFPDPVGKAVIFIETMLGKAVKIGIMTAEEAAAKRRLLKVSTGDDLSALADADFVIEAVPEDLQLKRKMFAELEKVISPKAVIATNTSSFLPSDLAAELQYKDRFCAMHFFNPVRTMKLIEIAATQGSSPETIAKTLALTKALGKVPVLLDQECPGLIVNRVLVTGMAWALDQLQTLKIDPWKIDEAMEKFGMAMGPFKTLDLVGFDIGYHVMKVMMGYYPQDYPQSVAGIPLNKDKNLLGKKTGKGFYIWKGEEAVKPNKAILEKFGWKTECSSNDDVNAARNLLLLSMTREAKKIVDTGVCKSPDMVDLSLIHGAMLFANRRGLLLNPPVTITA